MLLYSIDVDYEIREMVAEEFYQATEKLTREIFDEDSQYFTPMQYLSKPHKAMLVKLKSDIDSTRIRRFWCVYFRGKVVGWTFGEQDQYDTFYVKNSAILPAHRRKGLYTKLTRIVLETSRELGFLRVTSKHQMTNNAVLIAKLKLGFVILGTEVHERYGALVNLAYLHQIQSKKIIEYRTGSIRPDSEILSLIGLRKQID